MLYIDKATILKFDLEMLKKHRRAIQFIAVLLFIVGLLCISFPFVSGDILSTVVGALLICSGIALIVGLFSNRSHAGVIRLMSWYRQRSMKGSWLQLVIGVLDIVIAWIFLGATPMVSVTLVSTLVGIELIFSAASLFSFASLFVKKQ